jgi:ribonuclease HII
VLLFKCNVYIFCIYIINLVLIRRQINLVRTPIYLRNKSDVCLMSLKLYYNSTSDVCVGVDEAGRGCMMGPVFAAAVIWDNTKQTDEIKDSKKMSRKKRKKIRDYIENNSLAFGVGYADHLEIDELNIEKATYLAMHRALSNIKYASFDRILVDGNRFESYMCNIHDCIIGGDNLYVNIAAASILAKEYHDDWITNNFKNDITYDLMNNKGYGTKKHIAGILEHGLTSYHRKTFCGKYI